jgi:hypothetical protein
MKCNFKSLHEPKLTSKGISRLVCVRPFFTNAVNGTRWDEIIVGYVIKENSSEVPVYAFSFRG